MFFFIANGLLLIKIITTIIFIMPMLVFKLMLMQDSMLYVVNGLLMLVSFFFCRVMLFPYLYYW